MTIKNLFVFLSCAAVFCLTFSVSFVAAQIVSVDEKSALSEAIFPKDIAGAWHFNSAESDNVLIKIAELLNNRNAAATVENGDAKQPELPAVSISIFAPDALILSDDAAGEVTINEIFRSLIETRTVVADGIAREYEVYPKAKLGITATRQTDGFTVVTVSPRGNRMTETFTLASGGAKLIVVVRIEKFRSNEILNLRRVYDRAAPDDSFAAE